MILTSQRPNNIIFHMLLLFWNFSCIIWNKNMNIRLSAIHTLLTVTYVFSLCISIAVFIKIDVSFKLSKTHGSNFTWLIFMSSSIVLSLNFFLYMTLIFSLFWRSKCASLVILGHYIMGCCPAMSPSAVTASRRLQVTLVMTSVIARRHARGLTIVWRVFVRKREGLWTQQCQT